MSKHIAFLVNDLSFFFSHRLAIGKSAVEKGCRVSVIGPEDDVFAKKIQAFGMEVHYVSLHRKSCNILSEARTVIQLIRLCRKLKPNLIHNITIKPVIYGNIAAIFAAIPGRVNAISGLGYIFINQGVKAKFLRFVVGALYRFLLNRRYSYTIFQNPDDQQRFIEHGLVKKEKSYLIRGSGVDVNEYYFSEECDLRPLSVVLGARMLWDKGVGEYVEAAQIVKQVFPDVSFLLAGGVDSGNPAGIPKETLQQWHQQGIIQWLGHQSDMIALYRNAHIVCLPSYREGLPRTLIEAAACGRAIVTTDVPGCREVVKHQETGLLVPVKSATCLAEALLQLLNDTQLRREMGRRGRQLVEEELAIEIVLANTFAIYDEFFSNSKLNLR